MDTELVVNEVKTALAAIADQVGSGAEHFWPIFVKQQVIEGSVQLLTSIGAVLIFTVLAIICFRRVTAVLEMIK